MATCLQPASLMRTSNAS
ncbi:hypothetical protein YPPY94_1842, partial [Yersinia pestis PY-94]